MERPGELGVDEPVSRLCECFLRRAPSNADIVVPVSHFQEQVVQVVEVIPPESFRERMVEIVEEIVKAVQTFPQERCHHGIVCARILKSRPNFAANSGVISF